MTDTARDGLVERMKSNLAIADSLPGATNVPITPDDLRALLAQHAEDVKRNGELVELVRLFPEAYGVLTRQEMRDAKGNWRSLIDQQIAALKAIRAALQSPDGKDTCHDNQ